MKWDGVRRILEKYGDAAPRPDCPVCPHIRVSTQDRVREFLAGLEPLLRAEPDRLLVCPRAVRSLLDALSERAARLAAEAPGDFALSLIPPLVEALTDWLEGRAPKTWMAWTWRMAPQMAGDLW
jgi:hypothetical protein